MESEGGFGGLMAKARSWENEGELCAGDSEARQHDAFMALGTRGRVLPVMGAMCFQVDDQHQEGTRV